RRLVQNTLAIIERLHPELKQRFAWQLHLGAQGQAAIALETHYAPEVQRFSVSEGFWISPPSSQTRAANQLIHPSTDLPENICGIPTVPTANPAHGAKDRPRRCFHGNLPNVTEDGSSCPVWVASNGTSHRPTGFHVVFSHLVESLVYRSADAQKFLGNETGNATVATYHWILQSLRQRARNGVAQGCDQLNPVRAQAWRQHWYRNNQTAPQTEFFRHDAHDVAVTEHVRSANVEYAARCFRYCEDSYQVSHYIPDRDRLTWGANPFGGDHDGQSFHQVAQDFEGCRA